MAFTNEFSYGGRWNDLERKHHINALELLFSYHSVTIPSVDKFKHFKVMIMPQLLIIFNNMSGIKSCACNEFAQKILVLCSNLKVWISVMYIPGKKNFEAGNASRNFANDNIEWMLDKNIFSAIRLFGQPNFDLFCNKQQF